MLNSRLALIYALFAMVITATSVLALNVGENAPAFDLKDQFDKSWSLSSMKGSIAVLVVATPKSGEAMEPWTNNLGQKYGQNIKLVGMMDLHSLPKIIRSIAKSRIKKETQQPLMLDFSGSTSKEFGANDKSPVVIVIDQNSKIQAVAVSYSEEAFASTTVVIDKLLAANKK